MKIKNITKSKEPSITWDLEVEVYHNYILDNGIISHNSAQVSNSTNGVEPPRELVTKKSDKNTSFNKLVPFYKQFKNYYTTAWGEDFNNSDYLKMIACIQHYVDQAISLNLYTNTEKVDKISIGEMIDLLVESFNLGIKTWYYQNFRTTFDIDGLKDDSQEGCASGGCSV